MPHDALESLVPTHRRSFLGRLAAGAVALTATGGVTGARLAFAEEITPTTPLSSVDSWLAGIHGKHKQFFDSVSVNDGWVTAFAMNFLNTTEETYKLTDKDVTAIIGLRHFSIPMAFTDTIWAKYKLGEFFKLNDAGTNAPAVRNRYYNPHEGELMAPGMALDKLLARGVIVTCCNVALTVLSDLTAKAAGLPGGAAAKAEWTAGMIPGVKIVPSGVLAVNRAQERGCTYCSAG